MKKFTLFFAALCCAVTINALEIFRGVLRYDISLTTHRATVVKSILSISSADPWGNYKSVYGPITIPATIEYEGETYQVTAIADEAFQKAKDITSVTIPEGVTTIGRSAFERCPSLTSVTLPESVTSIGENAFASCTALPSLKLPDGLTVIPANMCSYCMAMETIDFPTSLVEIGENAFSRCIGLTELKLPNGTALIGNSVFRGCTSLRSLTLPASVAAIGENAFKSCRNLRFLKCHITPPLAINENVFEDVTMSKISLFVPNQSLNTYKSYNVWKNCTVYPLNYNISFVVNGQTVYTVPMEVFTPAAAVKEEAHAVLQQVSIPAGKVFKHWNPEITAVARNQAYEAVIESNSTVTKCSIAFTTDGGNRASFLLDEGSPKSEVEYYAQLYLDQVNTPLDREFKYWEPALMAVSDNQTYNAVFDFIDQNEYTISYVVNSDTVLAVDLKYGTEDWVVEEYAAAATAMAVYPEGMTFKDWDKYFDKVTGPETYTARLRPIGEGIEEVSSSLQGRPGEASKFLRNGVLFIDRNGKTYNAQGALIIAQ